MDVQLWATEVLIFGKCVHAKNTQYRYCVYKKYCVLSAEVSSYTAFLPIFLCSAVLYLGGLFYSY